MKYVCMYVRMYACIYILLFEVASVMCLLLLLIFLDVNQAANLQALGHGTCFLYSPACVPVAEMSQGEWCDSVSGVEIGTHTD